jgi:[ribosomal protein S5]-alanine N-acetyltransferase
MSKQLPTLRTQRLLLRPFSIDDALRVQQLAGAKEVYATTLTVPHPYADGMAEKWIATHTAQFYSDRGVAFAVTRGTDGLLIGAISLGILQQHRRAELGYWIGIPYWNNGYCTEAAIAVIRHGFEERHLHKITSRYIVGNVASETVMIKAGMKKEGELADEVLKDGVFHTIGVYGLINPNAQRP